jgi:glycosylphosphatidylinositol deacylase
MLLFRMKYVTSFLLLGLGAYSAVYGVTYAYRLHHLVNILAAWLVAIHFSRTRPTVAGILEIFMDDSDEGQKKRHQ